MSSKKILTVIPYSIRIIRILSAKTLENSLPLQQLRVLFLIKEGLKQTEIAEALQVSTAAISKAINLLVKKKYVIRRAGTDRRSISLKITKDGQKILTQVQDQLTRHLDNQLKKLTKKERDRLNSGLLILEKVMGQVYEYEA